MTHPGDGDGQALGRAAEVEFLDDREERLDASPYWAGLADLARSVTPS